jgi:hypothetical protein
MTAPFKQLCRDLAPLVTEAKPLGLDPYALLYMLGGVESSFGLVARQARFEKAFSRGGPYFVPELDKEFGDMAACSYGPWQIMFVNARRVCPEVTPEELRTSVRAAGVASALFLNSQLAAKKPQTAAEVLDVWNTGTQRDSLKPSPHYTDKGVGYYRSALDD